MYCLFDRWSFEDIMNSITTALSCKWYTLLNIFKFSKEFKLKIKIKFKINNEKQTNERTNKKLDFNLVHMNISCKYKRNQNLLYCVFNAKTKLQVKKIG